MPGGSRSKEERRIARNKFDSLLTRLADGAGIDREFERIGNAAADKVLRLLHRESGYSLNRFIIGGGKGKRTSIQGHVDYDCVVFLNYQEPPFTAVIREFKELLVGHLSVNVKITPYSVQFTLSGVDFDLLPASNEVETHSTSDTGSEQVRRTLEKIRSIPGHETRYFSAGLTEAAVDFIKGQSLFAHRFIRLCKKWNLGVHVTLSGRSTMVETVAVQVAQEEERFVKVGRRRKGAPSLRVALTHFFEKMHSGDIDVAFYDNYPESDVPPHIAGKSTKVIDVTNPKNNLLPDGLPSVFSTKAKKSLGVILNDLCPAIYQRELTLSDIEKIFH